MFKNYFKTAWRNLMNNKMFSFINIIGLTLGITCSLLIFLWVLDEFRYDNFQSNALYKAMLHNKDKTGNISNSMDAAPGLLPDALKKQIPEVQYAATVVWDNDMIFTVGKKVIKENGRYAGNDFFNLFNFPLLQGSPSTVLASPDNIVITQKLAKKYFNNENPIGKIIRIDNKRDYIVSGVAADVPENSSVTFDFILPIQHCFDDNAWMVAGWDHFGPATYVKLRDHSDINKVNNKIKNFLTQQDATITDKALSLVTFKSVYLHGGFTNGVPDGGRIDYVKMFSIIAAFILSIACINFINLATARSVKRAKEVGVRKAIGAIQSALFRQFVMEAILTAFIAVLLSIGLVTLLLPYFNRLTEKQIALHFDTSFIVALISITLITGIIAGSYPALVLSSFNPITVLKGSFKFGTKSSLLRKGLVVFQFSLSIILIICTAVVYKQMHYIQTKDLGLNRSNIVYIPIQGEIGKHFQSFKHELMQSGKFENVAASSGIPTEVNSYSANINWEGKRADDKTALAEMDIDYDFIKTMKIKIKEGRDFSPLFGTDTANFIVNETAVKLMQVQNPVGTMFSHRDTKGKIIGVVKDFHMQSLHNAIAPLFFTLQPTIDNGPAAIRINAGKTKDAMTVLEQMCKKYNPLFPFDYIFADDAFSHQYHDEMIVEQLSNAFALLAIICCMGLFGLAMFIAEQRTKEIGIRKVLGASVGGIFAMLSKDFLRLVIISAIIAFPVAWWAMNNWLRSYTYKTELSWWLFAVSGLLTLLIALISVSFQSVKAALANPVKSLRTE